MQSKVSGHWTDDQLIAHLYGVGSEDDHLERCSACQTRLAAMRARHEWFARAEAEVSSEFLAAQRRRIYAKISEPVRWWSGMHMRRWASAAATLLLLGGGVLIYEEHHQQQLVMDQVSDAQLAEQVSSLAQDSEPQPTAPLKALFVE